MGGRREGRRMKELWRREGRIDGGRKKEAGRRRETWGLCGYNSIYKAFPPLSPSSPSLLPLLSSPYVDGRKGEER